jgi:hypothetical protein
MQFDSLIDSFPCFTRLNPCVAHCSTDLIPWVHHSREEGSLDYDRGFVCLQIHMNFDTIIYRQQLCMLVCFGSKGCVLVPRSSSTSVAAWTWPTSVVSRRRVLEAVFILFESSSPSRKIFIGSHSLPPLWFTVSVLHRAT